MDNDIKSEGEKIFKLVKNNIPPKYYNSVTNIQYIRGGQVYERLLKQILKEQNINVEKPKSYVFPILRGEKEGGYLKPDLHLKDKNVYIEVTTWGDSNMIFSKIMQGYLLKKKFPDAKYYVVIADLNCDGKNWTWSKDVELWKNWSKIGEIVAVDDWFGFKNIDALIERII